MSSRNKALQSNQIVQWLTSSNPALYHGKEYEGIEFVPFVVFIKCDTKEADLLAGSYSSRTGNVQQLCRYCTCPTQNSDDPMADFPPKTVPMIGKLVAERNLSALKDLSQHPIDNACYKLRFGSHNTHGVHGACPLEMLHALLLGVFKYIRDCFFEQLGKDSKVADEINALIALYGDFYSHQSDRNMPKTKFSSGIQQGKLMAKEYTGVLLLIATTLFTTKGYNTLVSGRRSTFGKNNGVDDWTLLVETLLMWEEWLNPVHRQFTSLDHLHNALDFGNSYSQPVHFTGNYSGRFPQYCI